LAIGRWEQHLGKNTSVVLGESQTVFVRSQIAKGRFATVSEAVCEGIALLEQRALQMEQLRKLIAEGDASGDFQEVDFDELLGVIAA
jgi:antitoxin ParD1/3/4